MGALHEMEDGFLVKDDATGNMHVIPKAGMRPETITSLRASLPHDPDEPVKVEPDHSTLDQVQTPIEDEESPPVSAGGLVRPPRRKASSLPPRDPNPPRRIPGLDVTLDDKKPTRLPGLSVTIGKDEEEEPEEVPDEEDRKLPRSFRRLAALQKAGKI